MDVVSPKVVHSCKLIVIPWENLVTMDAIDKRFSQCVTDTLLNHIYEINPHQKRYMDVISLLHSCSFQLNDFLCKCIITKPWTYQVQVFISYHHFPQPHMRLTSLHMTMNNCISICFLILILIIAFFLISHWYGQ